jgi:hypothetical protein
MPVNPIPLRFPTAAAIQSLDSALGLPPSGQDWEMEVADPRRVSEFLDLYESGKLDEDGRFSLMSLVVASYDELLRESGDRDQRLWARIRRYLLDHFDVHAYTVQYWSFPDEDDDYDPDEVFPFTPYAREVMAAKYGPRESWPREPFSVKRFTDWPDPVVPGVPLDSMEISDERDGTYALCWSKFEKRPFGERRGFKNVDDAVEFAAREFGVPQEKWRDV